MGITTTFFGMYYYNKMYEQRSPEPLTRSIVPQKRFSSLIKKMLDPNDPKDAELLHAKNTREMARILKRSKKYLDNN